MTPVWHVCTLLQGSLQSVCVQLLLVHSDCRSTFPSVFSSGGDKTKSHFVRDQGNREGVEHGKFLPAEASS